MSVEILTNFHLVFWTFEDIFNFQHIEAEGDIFEISVSSMAQSYRRNFVSATCVSFICFECADQVWHLNQFLVRA